MGTPLVIGIVIYLLLIIVLTAWFLRIHSRKSLTDLEQNTSLPSGTDTISLENRNRLAESVAAKSVARDDAPALRPTETDSFPKKK